MAATGAHDEPDLVPLLDLVLQLVMFFMLCAGLYEEQMDQSIILPTSQSAKPMATQESLSDVVFLNVNAKGELQVLGRAKPLSSQAPSEDEDEETKYLKSVREESRKRAAERIQKAGGDPAEAKPDALVIVRAHEAVDYDAIYRVLRKCQHVGLGRLQLRARIDRGKP